MKEDITIDDKRNKLLILPLHLFFVLFVNKLDFNWTCDSDRRLQTGWQSFIMQQLWDEHEHTEPRKASAALSLGFLWSVVSGRVVFIHVTVHMARKHEPSTYTRDGLL